MFKCHFSEIASEDVLYISRYIYIRSLSMAQCSYDTLTSPSDHSRSYEVKFDFVSNFCKIHIERWECFQRVLIAKTHRMICNITYFAQRVTLRVLDLSSKFDIAILRSTYTHFDASRREEQYAAKIRSLAYIAQKLFEKSNFSKNLLFLHFLTFEA